MYTLSVDGAQPVSTSIPSRNGLQMENVSQMVLPPADETEKKSQLSSARPRPDHLPLGSPDPKAHPLYLGLASLTSKLITIFCIHCLAAFQMNCQLYIKKSKMVFTGSL